MTKKQDTKSDKENKDDDNSPDTTSEQADAVQANDNTAASSETTTDDSVNLQEKVEQLQKELEVANAKVEENWEHFVRTKADLDNLERRTQRDIENAHKYAADKFLEAIIPVIDSLEMGAEAAKQEGADVAKLREGMELTLKMFADTLHKFEVKKLDPVGDAFNPDFHQAMSMQESDEHNANTVLTVMQKGYLLNERLIRPALVVVSKAGNKQKNSEAKDQEGAATDANNSADDSSEASLGNTVDEKA